METKGSTLLPRGTYALLTQACSVKMAGYWPSSSFCVFMNRDEVEVCKNAKKERGIYPAILTKRLHQRISLLREQSGEITSGQDGPGCQSEHRIHFILPARGASHAIK